MIVVMIMMQLVHVSNFDGPLDPLSCLARSLEKVANISSLSFEDESLACNFIKMYCNALSSCLANFCQFFELAHCLVKC